MFVFTPTKCYIELKTKRVDSHLLCICDGYRNRDIGISDSLNGSKEGPYFEPHAMVSAKRLKSVNGHAQAYLKCALSDQLPVAVSAVMVKGRTDNALDSETISCEVKSGCTSSPIFEEKHSESNVGQVPSSVEARQESGKRKANQMGLSTSLGQRRRNKDSDLEYDSEIINLCLTANLVHKVERLLSENPDPANLEKARSILKVQEKDLLDAIVKLCEVSYDAAYFSANGQADITYTHDDGKGDEEMLPKPANSSDETPPGTTRPRDGGAGNHAKIQGSSSAITTGGTASSSSIIPPLMETRPHAPVSPTSAPTSLGESSGVLYTAHPPHAPLVAVGSASGAPVPRKKRPIIKTKTIAELEQRWWMSKKRQLAKTPPLSQQLSSMTTKFTPEQRWRMWEFAHRVGWSIRKAGADAVDAFCAQVGVSQRALKKWMSNNKHLANIPPPSSPTPPLPLHHQDHPPAASPPQGSTTEQGKSPESPPQGSATEQGKSHEPEAAAPADDGGKEDKNEEASEETQQGGGKGRRSRKPSKLYSGAEWVSK
ncbi:hypothetical protein HU200_049273 [Digitaria exilis]|uniref:Uncharacterized protein n=1 Tax=Digitaria exilis TaxID=1010633 RepID=A0A835AV06_9POAL|nr:hypothetical protein HU200_049273 [Digitaria exilis]